MTHRLGRKLDFGRKLLLACASIAAVAGPIAIGVEAQSQYATPLSFDPVLIKSGQTGWLGGRGRGIRNAPDGGLSVINTTLKMLVSYAFDLRYSQLAGGPDWLDSDTFDIEAKPKSVSSPEQLRVMLQTLLTDRFKLTFHHEIREMPVYALAVAIDGRDGIRLGGCHRDRQRQQAVGELITNECQEQKYSY